METYEPIDADEASAALASARYSRARVAWSGYPTWYWPATGAVLGGLSCTFLLPGWPAFAVPVALGVLFAVAVRAASRARGVREGWACGAMTHRDAVALYGPAALVILAGAAGSKFASWAPAAAAVLVFMLVAGTGLALGARAARR